MKSIAEYSRLAFLDDIRRTMCLDAEEERKLLNSMKFSKFKKGDTIEGQNEILRNMIYVISGSARTYYIEHGHEHNYAFTFASNFLLRPEKIIRGGHYQIFVQFMEPAEVCYIPMPDLNTLDKKRQGEVYKYICLGLIKYAEFLEDQTLMLHLSAKERYQWVLERYPKLLDLITITQLASYINVTKETLYRIRSGKY